MAKFEHLVDYIRRDGGLWQVSTVALRGYYHTFETMVFDDDFEEVECIRTGCADLAVENHLDMVARYS